MTPELFDQCLRPMRMVAVLHGLGFERLRIFPYMGPLAWRLQVGPSDAFFENGVAMHAANPDLVAYHGGACGPYSFNWNDAEFDDPAALADRFTARMPVLMDAARGADPGYAHWLRRLMEVLETRRLLPVLFGEYTRHGAEDADRLELWSFFDDERIAISLPPPPLAPGDATVVSGTDPALMEARPYSAG